MTVRASQASRWALGAAVGIACLFISESGPITRGSSLIAQANARTGRALTPSRHARIARRTTPRAIVGGAVGGTIYFGDFGNSAAASTGYAPGTYGGVGCYRNTYGVLVCP